MIEFVAPLNDLNAVVRLTAEDLSMRDDPLARYAHLGVQGNELTVVARDSVTTVVTKLSVVGTGNGSVSVDQRRLADFLRRSVGDDVRLKAVGAKLRMRSGAATIELPTQEANLALPAEASRAAASVSAESLRRVLRRVL